MKRKQLGGVQAWQLSQHSVEEVHRGTGEEVDDDLVARMFLQQDAMRC